MNHITRLSLSLLLLRVSVFLVMAVWTLDKFVRPEHAARIFAHFYRIDGMGTFIIYGLGVLELLVLTVFLLGLMKRWTYALVLTFHAVSTLSSYKEYLTPFENLNLLFFAAWPMLAACTTLYLLRDADTLSAVTHLKHPAASTHHLEG